MITHANLYHTAINATKMHHYEESDFGIAFLPLTHMLQRMTVYAALHLGIVGAYAESIDKLVENFQELHPPFKSAYPRSLSGYTTGSTRCWLPGPPSTPDISMGRGYRPGSGALPS